jgi:hypothetical protein
MNKIIILVLLLVLVALSLRMATKSNKIIIKILSPIEKTIELDNRILENNDTKILRFETHNARYSLAPNSNTEFNPNIFNKGSIRFQPLWKKDIHQFKISDLNIEIKFGDFFIKRIDKDRILFLSLNGLAEVSLNQFNYQIKDNIFFIYETNKDSMNLLTLFNTKLDTLELNKILRQDNSGFFDVYYDEKINDLELKYIKFQK